MKNLKIIPILAIVALLSACGESKQQKVKAPKFDKEGDAIEKADFFETLEFNSAGIDISNSKRIGSKVLTMSYGSSWATSVTRENKLYKETAELDFGNSKSEMDAKSAVIRSTSEWTSTDYTNYPNFGSEEESYKEMYDDYYQVVNFDGKDYYAYVNAKQKTVSIMGPAENVEERAEAFDYFAKSSFYYGVGLQYAEQMFNTASGASDEEIAKYWGFYKNGDTLTLSYNYEEEPVEVYDNPDSENPVLQYTEKNSATAKLQITFTGSSFKLVQYQEYNYECTYAVDIMGNMQYYAGDVYKEGRKFSLTSEMKDAKLNVKPVNYEGFYFYVS
ncbi:MAG: hypothetical protein J5511_05645 [Bacilli bacterium]|nr:hypothetical protein [Bacilli bacterium]